MSIIYFFLIKNSQQKYFSYYNNIVIGYDTTKIKIKERKWRYNMIYNRNQIENILSLNEKELLEIIKFWLAATLAPNGFWTNNTLVFFINGKIHCSYFPISLSPSENMNSKEVCDSYLFGLPFIYDSERPKDINEGVDRLKNLLKENISSFQC